MNQVIFSIYDNKALSWGTPYYSLNNAVGTRQFEDAVNQPDTPFNKHPEDYVLFAIGEFDQHTGELIPYEQSKNLGLAADYIHSEIKPIRAVT